MDGRILLDNLETFVEGPGGTQQLRQLIVGHAVTGRLNTGDDSDESANLLLQRARADLGLELHTDLIGNRDVLPPRWVMAEVAEVCLHQLGKMLNKKTMTGEPTRYLRSVNVRDGSIDLSDLNEMLLSPDDRLRYSVCDGDILVVEGGDVGRCAVWSGPNHDSLTFQNQLHRLRPVAGISSEYLLLTLRHLRWTGEIAARSTGVTIKHFSASALRRLQIPLPPLAEQNRIVARVDELLGLCDEWEARDVARRRHRSHFRSSAFHAVTQADTKDALVVAWDRVSTAFHSIADDIEACPDIEIMVVQLATSGRLCRLPQSAEARGRQHPSGTCDWALPSFAMAPPHWQRREMATLGVWGSGGTPLKSRRDFYGGDIPWAVIGDLNNGLVVETENRISETGLIGSSAKWIAEGSVLIAMYGSIGKTGIAGIRLTTNQAIAHCVPDPSVISTEYLHLVARALKPALVALGKGGAQMNISQQILKSLFVPVPPLDEQMTIVRCVEKLERALNRLSITLEERSAVATRLNERASRIA